MFDPLIHEPTRMRLCAALVPVTEADFAALQDRLEVSASALSKHLRALQEAGYVQLAKRSAEGRVRTYVTLTDPGRLAFCGHVSEMQRMAALVRRARPADRP